MNVRDYAERLVWTMVSAFTGGLGVGALVTDVSTLKAAAIAAAAAGVNFITLVARQRLSVLPAPGGGLPLLPNPKP